MRIVHTSDWHLGRKFGPVSLRSDQEAFTDWFVDLVADERADLVIDNSGDLAALEPQLDDCWAWMLDRAGTVTAAE